MGETVQPHFIPRFGRMRNLRPGMLGIAGVWLYTSLGKHTIASVAPDSRMMWVTIVHDTDVEGMKWSTFALQCVVHLG